MEPGLTDKQLKRSSKLRLLQSDPVLLGHCRAPPTDTQTAPGGLLTYSVLLHI